MSDNCEATGAYFLDGLKRFDYVVYFAVHTRPHMGELFGLAAHNVEQPERNPARITLKIGSLRIPKRSLMLVHTTPYDAPKQLDVLLDSSGMPRHPIT